MHMGGPVGLLTRVVTVDVCLLFRCMKGDGLTYSVPEKQSSACGWASGPADTGSHRKCMFVI